MAKTYTWTPLEDVEAYFCFTPERHAVAACIRSEDRGKILAATGVGAACRNQKTGIQTVVLRGLNVPQEMMDKATQMSLECIAYNRAYPKPEGYTECDHESHKARMTPKSCNNWYSSAAKTSKNHLDAANNTNKALLQQLKETNESQQKLIAQHHKQEETILMHQ